jgi:hypothetical protein
MQGTKQPRAKQPRMQNRRRACVPLHWSLCGGLGGWGLQVLWSLGVFRRAVRKRACCCSPVLKPLQVCPHDPPLLPLPPGEAPPRAAPAPPQAGHKRRRPAAPPCPGWPTAAALLAADPCKPARAACRERELFIGTQFSNLYTTVDTPARGRVGVCVVFVCKYVLGHSRVSQPLNLWLCLLRQVLARFIICDRSFIENS